MAEKQFDGLRRMFETLGGAMAPAEAFYTILAAAVVSDGESHPSELAELDALVHRVRTLNALREKDAGEFNSMKRRVDERVGAGKNLEALVQDAAHSIANDAENKKHNGAMAWAIFAHAGDIVFADGKVVQKEIEFMMKLAPALGLSETDASGIIEFLRKKNSY